jgi:CxxC-x17-CxxC domain-containing protein
MEEHRDEQIHCADCGASFVFSANEAAVFAQRGLTAPKRCKDCRRARKERAANEGGGGAAARWSGQGQSAASWGARRASPRYTGDVNEYRSPMQDGFSATRHPGVLTGSTDGGIHRPRRAAGEYRSPMQDRSSPRAQGPREDGNVRAGGRPRGAFGGPGRDASMQRAKGRAPRAPADAEARENAGAAAPSAKAARRRPPPTMFAITCNTCGAQAEVPFEPAEGREVYCPTCYRARRTPS